MNPWTQQASYAARHLRQGAEPAHLWDRIRMFFGFARKSPATTLHERVAEHVSRGDISLDDPRTLA